MRLKPYGCFRQPIARLCAPVFAVFGANYGCIRYPKNVLVTYGGNEDQEDGNGTKIIDNFHSLTALLSEGRQANIRLTAKCFRPSVIWKRRFHRLAMGSDNSTTAHWTTSWDCIRADP